VNYDFLQSFELENLIKQLMILRNISKRLLNVFNITLLKMLPRIAQSKLVTINDLFEWNLWPGILTAFGMLA